MDCFNIKFILASVVFLNSTVVFSQSKINTILAKTTLQVGYTHSVQSAKPYIFSNFRRPNTGIQSPSIGIGYSIFSMNNSFNIQACASFTAKGTVFDWESDDNTKYEIGRYQYILHFLDIPIMGSYKIKKYTFLFGPVLSVLLDNDYRTDGVIIMKKSGSRFGPSYAERIDNRFKIFDYGLRMGAAFEIHKGISFLLNYQKNFSLVDKRRMDDVKYQVSFLAGFNIAIQR